MPSRKQSNRRQVSQRKPRPNARTNDARSFQNGITFTKLRNGKWGVRAMGPIANKIEGYETVTVTLKNGTEKDVEITACIWRGRFDRKDVALFATD